MTNSAGWFTARLQVVVSAPWFAQYDGSQLDFASARIPVTATGTSPAGPGPMTPRVRVMARLTAPGELRVTP